MSFTKLSDRSGHRAPRGRFRTVVAALAATVALSVSVSACGGGGGGGGGGTSSDGKIAAPAQDVGTRLSGTVPADIQHLPLTDQNGKKTDLAAFKGKILVVNDLMTLCQETCPLDTADMVRTAQQVTKDHHASDVEFLSITVDPERDDPAQLKAYRKLFAQAPPDWTLLTGSPDTIAKLWKYFGVWTKKVPQDNPPPKNWRTGKTLTYDVEHSDELFFLDRSGHERFLIEGTAHVADGTLPSTLRHYLSDKGVKNLEHPNGDAWTVPQALQTLSWLLQHRLAAPSGSSAAG
ncbi:SCO family protein [Streptomyces beihaiensis]|uniref:SCO family protein n=1 Tax=Streptomyces beihaiensis TaxID=2984495 RepID=A0ABT3TWD3_9ACTN|nr:SCO family protein [Streptomyces beihaiensis]MCX3060687.1 SCO family protein [Streptomyces beihaiensis]